MTIIDLGTVRATRAAELQAAKELTDAAVAAVKAAAEGYAEIAFGLSGLVRLHERTAGGRREPIAVAARPLDREGGHPSGHAGDPEGVP